MIVPVTSAGLAAAASNVEGEAAREVPAGSRLGSGREQLPYPVEQLGVRGGVRPGRSTDRRLVDVDHLVQLLGALDTAVAARYRPRTVQPVVKCLRQDLLHQGRLATPRHSGYRDEHAEREHNVEIAEVVLVAPTTVTVRPSPGRRRSGVGILRRPAQVVTGQGGRFRDDLGYASFRHNMASVLPRTGSQVDYVVCGADGLLVVFDHDERVTQVPETEQGLQEAAVVPLVQADRWLVENVEHPHQARTDLGGQSDPLGFPSGEGGSSPVQCEVLQTHVEQELEPGADLLEYRGGDGRLPLAQFQRFQDREGLADGTMAQLEYVQTPQCHCQRHRIEAGRPRRSGTEPPAYIPRSDAAPPPTRSAHGDGAGPGSPPRRSPGTSAVDRSGW